MADKKKSIFERIGAKFKGVVSELKKVVWPSKDKLKSIAAVVFVVILFFAIYLTAINQGGHWLLEKVGFYELTTETTVEETEATVAETEAAAETEATEASESVDTDIEAVETTEETSDTTTESTTEAE